MPPPHPAGPALAAVLTCLVLASSCANPTTAYHRQLEYLRRTSEEALTAGRDREARDRLAQAVALAGLADVPDAEVVSLLTLHGTASRRLGALDEASNRLEAADRLLAPRRLEEGGLEGALRRAGASHALELARLESTRGDFAKAEAAARDFLAIRGDDSDDAESAEARTWLAELLLARGMDDEARAELDAAEPAAGALPAAARGRLLLRLAEAELDRGGVARAAQLVEAVRPDGTAPESQRAGLLLVLARTDLADGSSGRAGARLEVALQLLAERGPSLGEDPASLARAVELARRVHAADPRALRTSARRAGALAGDATPLARLQLGGTLTAAGRDLLAAGLARDGLQTLEEARQVLQDATGGRAHVSRLRADFASVAGLVAADRLDRAAARCEEVLRSGQVLGIGPIERVDHLVACGGVDARRGDVARARGRFLEALYDETAPPAPHQRLELLVRLAALCHLEDGASAERKFFERAVPLAADDLAALEVVLVDAYHPIGSFEPSSAAARMAHVAARSTEWHASAGALQQLARRLGAGSTGAASRRD